MWLPAARHRQGTVERGHAVKAGSVKRTRSSRRGYILTKRRRSSPPFFNNYRPQFYSGPRTYRASARYLRHRDDHARRQPTMDVELITPIAMEESNASPFRRAARPSAQASSSASLVVRNSWRPPKGEDAGAGVLLRLAMPVRIMHYNPRGPLGRRKRFRRSVAQSG